MLITIEPSLDQEPNAPLGIEYPTQVPQTPLQQLQQSQLSLTLEKQKPRRIASVTRNVVVKRKNRPRIRLNNRTPATNISDAPAAQTVETMTPSAKVYKTSIKPGIINKGLAETLKIFLAEKKQSLGITEDGKFYRNLKDKNPIKDSNIDSVTAYFTGQSEAAETPGIYYIYQRLSKEPKFQEFIERSNIASTSSSSEKSQSGKGIKKYIIKTIPKIKNIKKLAATKGLTRIKNTALNTNKNSSNKFKPQLWVKLGL